MDPTKSIQNFDKLLRTPPEEAARQILDAVLKNKRRLSSVAMQKFWMHSSVYSNRRINVRLNHCNQMDRNML